MSSRFMTNNEVVALFKEADELKLSDLPEKEKDAQISKIHNKIIEGLSFIVYSNVRQYRKFPNYEDLVQEGFVGLVKAVKKFNHTLFPNFFVYSERWIRHSVKRAASRFDVVYNPKRHRVVYAEPAEIGEEQEAEETPEDTFFTKETSQKIEEVLEDFPLRDRDIIKRIFGLGDYDSQTLREIGPVYDLTHERVRQIKNKVISKLCKSDSLNELY